ncbi:MAG: hypothetical protein KDA31_02450 [Phycisphaerales bacterium]|nr:hypothetical protein [Phycisphaerales bacterium]MCB9837288.1 hypothetical protein [Phycisphaera sp.]
MQILGPDEGSLPALPKTPLLEHWLFESPTLLTGLLVVLGVVALIAALRRKKKLAPLIGAVVLFVLAAGVYVTAGLVTTDREVLMGRTAELVGAVAEGNADGVRAILAEPFRINPSDNASGNARRVPRITDFEQIRTAIEKWINPLIGSHQILETRAGMEGPSIGRTLVRVRVRMPDGGLLGHSWWEIEWRRSGDTWLATRIEAVWIQG